MTLPRPEHPRPQFVRAHWMNLNGAWQFEIDPGDSGFPRAVHKRELTGEIVVPFCPESTLSGIGNTDFMNALWYRRVVQVPEQIEWEGKRLLLHFQAVDYDATVWVNGQELARHRGGFTPFTVDCGVVHAGQKLTVVVRARDDHRQSKPMGKQSSAYANAGCHYTRTTGIWQTVWMEPVSPTAHLLRPRVTPDRANRRFNIACLIAGNRTNLRLRTTLADAAGVITTVVSPAGDDFYPSISLDVPTERLRLWSPADPHLYTLRFELLNEFDEVIDAADGYAGLRSVTIDGMAVKINGETLFQRLVLDQGYYPDGILTAPDDQALIDDIRLSMEAGFNGARLHQKVFEERFLYHADRLGYLVWGEFGDWGPGPNDDRFTATFTTQWMEVLERDYNHPSIVGWCPCNETHDNDADRITRHDDVMRGMWLAAKLLDTTRPVLDTSGYTHRIAESDVYDAHNYTQDPAKFAMEMRGLADGDPYYNGHPALTKERSLRQVLWRGQPYFCSEFGGIWWNEKAACDPTRKNSWGYGTACTSIEEVYARFAGLCNVLLDNPQMFGYCYTQLTDVYQEENGIYDFNRKPKFDLARIRAIQTRPAAIELKAREKAKHAAAAKR